MINIIPENYHSLHETEQESWKHLQICMFEIGEHFEIKPTTNPHISHFYVVASKRKPIHFYSWEVKDRAGSFLLCLIQYDSLYMGYGRGMTGLVFVDTSIYFLGQLHLKRDFGIALIRPETWEDKINEIFEPVEIDFGSHLVFSFRYFVVAEDRTRFKQMLPLSLLTFMQKYPGLQLEFRNHQCLFRIPKTVEPEYGVLSCQIGVGLDKILNQ